MIIKRVFKEFLIDLKIVFKDMGLELENAVETQIKKFNES